MTIGFSGTRLGMTDEQYAAVKKLLDELGPTVVHHGGARGADSQFDALVYGRTTASIVVWPSREWYGSRTNGRRAVQPTMDPLRRNRQIVAHGSDGLIAAPKSAREMVRSGTWATIRYAREANRRIWRVEPSGVVVVETVV